MNSIVYLAIKDDAFEGMEIKVFQKRKDAVNQLKAWTADEFLALQYDYLKSVSEKKEEDAKDCIDWMVDIFKNMVIKEDNGEISAISWEDMHMEIQRKEIN